MQVPDEKKLTRKETNGRKAGVEVLNQDSGARSVKISAMMACGIPVWAWPVVSSLVCFAFLFCVFLLLGRGSRSFYLDPQDYAYYEKENLGDRKLPIAAMEKSSTFVSDI
jgi:hypothetical protein